jgi:F-type H+-transporting ATPase subunit a
MNSTESATAAIFSLGPIAISDTVVTTWGIMVGFGLLAWLVHFRLNSHASRWQTAVEAMVVAIEGGRLWRPYGCSCWWPIWWV